MSVHLINGRLVIDPLNEPLEIFSSDNITSDTTVNINVPIVSLNKMYKIFYSAVYMAGFVLSKIELMNIWHKSAYLDFYIHWVYSRLLNETLFAFINMVLKVPMKFCYYICFCFVIFVILLLLFNYYYYLFILVGVLFFLIIYFI